MQNFTDKVAVITGGASGVGRALALALADEGAKLVIADIEENALQRCKAELEERGAQCLAQRADVTQPESMAALAEAAFTHFSGVHLVFANAGVGTGEGGNMWEYSANDWEWGFRVNTWGLINTINAFVPRLVEQGEASVPHIREFLNKMEDIDFVVQRSDEEGEGRGRGRGGRGEDVGSGRE